MFNSSTSSFDTKNAGESRGTITRATSNDCTLEKSPATGSLIFKEDIFSSNNCFKTTAHFLSESAKLRAISQAVLPCGVTCDGVESDDVTSVDSGDATV